MTLSSPEGVEHEITSALARIIDHGQADLVALEDAGGRVLARDMYADREQPPFNRAAMDGIAISGKGLEAGTARLRCIAVLPAGGDPRPLQHAGDAHTCIEIMTGAAVPDGFDAVLRYEDIERVEEGGETWFTIAPSGHRLGENIHPCGADYSAGTRLLTAGTRIFSPHVAVLASCGITKVDVYPVPRIAILGTGDELVAPETTPLSHQIRASNPWSIEAELRSWGYPPLSRDTESDNSSDLTRAIETLLGEYDIVLLSGAVSRGMYDRIPGILDTLGVQTVIHGVRHRPGKPLLVGSRRVGGRPETLVLGLPGNPVSALVLVRRYLIPALASRAAHNFASRELAQGIPVCLAQELEFTRRLTWFPAVRTTMNSPWESAAASNPVADRADPAAASRSGEAGVDPAAPPPPAEARADPVYLSAEVLPGNGSGDFFQLADSTGFVEIPAELEKVPAGTVLRFFAWGA